MPRLFSSTKISGTPTPSTSTTTPSTTTAAQQTPSTTFLHHHPSLPHTFTDSLPLPKLLIFDLDYTLWPFWCDTHCSPPLKPVSGRDAGRVAKDRHGESFAFYPDVPGVLLAARVCGVKVAAASRTHAPDVAMELLRILHVTDQFGVARSGTSTGEDGNSNSNGKAKSETKGASKPAKDYFDNLQIFPGNKVTHMENIRKKMGVEFEEMLFFDDEERNRNVERERGVCFWLVRDGVTREEIDEGVRKWRKRRGISGRGSGEGSGSEDE